MQIDMTTRFQGLDSMKNSFHDEYNYDDFDQTPKYDEPAYDIGGGIDQSPRHHEAPELHEGDSVRHSLFGAGTVVEIDGVNVTVYFKGKGPKKLDISFAPLEKL
jgi:hypothetical protein